MDLIGFLIWAVILCAVCYVIFLVLNLLPIPEPFKRIVMAVFGLIVLIIVLTNLGGMLGGRFYYPWAASPHAVIR